MYLTFDLDLLVKVTRKVAQYPLHHVTYTCTAAKFEVATSNILGDTFKRKYTFGPLNLTQNDDQYPLHYVTYIATKFEIAKANGLRPSFNLAW